MKLKMHKAFIDEMVTEAFAHISSKLDICGPKSTIEKVAKARCQLRDALLEIERVTRLVDNDLARKHRKLMGPVMTQEEIKAEEEKIRIRALVEKKLIKTSFNPDHETIIPTSRHGSDRSHGCFSTSNNGRIF